MRDGTRSLLCAHSHPPPIHSSSNVSHLPVPYFVGQPTLYLIACLEERIYILITEIILQPQASSINQGLVDPAVSWGLARVVKSLPLATLIVPSIQYRFYNFCLKFSVFFFIARIVKSLPLATLMVPSTQYRFYNFFLKFSKFFFSDRGVDRHPWQHRKCPLHNITFICFFVTLLTLVILSSLFCQFLQVFKVFFSVRVVEKHPWQLW